MVSQRWSGVGRAAEEHPGRPAAAGTAGDLVGQPGAGCPVLEPGRGDQHRREETGGSVTTRRLRATIFLPASVLALLMRLRQPELEAAEKGVVDPTIPRTNCAGAVSTPQALKHNPSTPATVHAGPSST
ncbi:hypothetical protein AMK32_25345 [Streptomyces sp. CB01883]|nr:hypothetical protein AMK32_25345 [Streptomyces sp. CB01883]